MKTASRPAELSAPSAAEVLLTKAEAAARLNVAERFIERCVEQRRIRFVRVGRFVRIPDSAITDFVAAATVPVVGPQRRSDRPSERVRMGRVV